jgi:hypothetical protein
MLNIKIKFADWQCDFPKIYVSYNLGTDEQYSFTVFLKITMFGKIFSNACWKWNYKKKHLRESNFLVVSKSCS